MIYQNLVDQALPLDHMLTRRAQVVRFCLRFSSDPDVAEDLAQETLIEAWRHRMSLRDPEAINAWLYGIARNVCLRWLRREGRERARRVEQSSVDEHAVDWTQNIADNFDVELELERTELATLLDRALALLPDETRAVLIQKYVEDSPHAAIAERLGLSEGAVAMRVQRGKLALRHVLRTDLRAEATTYGIVDERICEWQETRLWCPLCGQSRLRALPPSSAAGFTLECPNCSDTPGGMLIQSSMRPLFADISSIKTAYSRIRAWSSQYSEQALSQRTAACIHCGTLAPLRQGVPVYAAAQHRQARALHVWCGVVNPVGGRHSTA